MSKYQGKYKYLLKRDKNDERDYKVTLEKIADILDKIDLRDKCPEVFNQGNLGSCSANAGVADYMYVKNDKELKSRLYLYFKERQIEGTVSEDSGASMRDICKALNKFGVCKEKLDPYIESNFAYFPSNEANIDASKHTITAYKRLSNVDEIKQYLAINKQPVLMGMDVYESFESNVVAKNGIVPLPNVNKEKFLGGHAVLIVGYNNNFGNLNKATRKAVKKNSKIITKANKSILDEILDLLFDRKDETIETNSNGYFIVRNSWGSDWGDKGYFYLPYSYIENNFANDFWVIE